MKIATFGYFTAISVAMKLGKVRLVPGAFIG